MSDVPVCKDCVHLVGVRGRVELAKEWQCAKSKGERDPVSGIQLYTQTCYEARNDPGTCGSVGSWFELYVQPEYSPPAGKRVASSKSADELLGELDI